MVNPQRGELLIKLGGQSLKARLTIDSLVRIETSIGCSIIKMANKLSLAEATITDIVNVLTPAIKGGGNDVNEKDIMKLIGKGGLIEAMKCAGEIVTTALQTGQDEGNEEAEKNKET